MINHMKTLHEYDSRKSQTFHKVYKLQNGSSRHSHIENYTSRILIYIIIISMFISVKHNKEPWFIGCSPLVEPHVGIGPVCLSICAFFDGMW